MAQAKVVVSIVMVVIVYITAIILLVIAIGNGQEYDECYKDESPNCFQFTCANRTNTCDYYAYRCDGAGRARCSYDPHGIVDVNGADGICST